jgi:choline dehydrogenase-like flavoprotein
VHGVRNVFVAGSSVFPTGGSVNPTLTIVALALRLAAHLKETALGDAGRQRQRLSGVFRRAHTTGGGGSQVVPRDAG